MNERIKELIIKVLGKEGVIESRAFGHWALDDAELEKFAELIVKECMILAQIDENQFNAAGYTSQAEGSFSVGLAIKEHFGVK
jgi:hypothetical protein